MGFYIFKDTRFAHFNQNISYKIILRELKKGEVLDDEDIRILSEAFQETKVKYPILIPEHIHSIVNKVAYFVLETPNDLHYWVREYGPPDFYTLNEETQVVLTRIWLLGNKKIELIFNFLSHVASEEKA